MPIVKTRLNLSLDEDLVGFIKEYASENRTTVADVLTQYLLALKRTVTGEPNARVISDPRFYAALSQVHRKLKAGKAKWHTYNDIFRD